MSNQLTTKSFIFKAKIKHGSRYNYSMVNYKSYRKKIIIICKKHGKFAQTPDMHIKSSGCRRCALEKAWEKRKITTEDFIKKAKKIHGNLLYDYSNVIYTGCCNKIIIICKKHNKFKQNAASHLRGAGCPKCKIDKTIERCKFTTKEFIEKMNKKHNFKYNYDKTIYDGDNSKVIITCKKHGNFIQRAHDHSVGQGCPKCGLESRSNKQKMPIKNFIRKANKIHHNFYKYDNIIYKNNRTKIIIGCPTHGNFLLSPDSHLAGYGCKKCKLDKKWKKNQIQFIKKSKKIHNNFYNYSKVIYRGSAKEVKIICPDHGIFLQIPDGHARGKGCSSCIKKEEYKVGCILKKEFKGWKINKSKKIFSKSHNRYRTFDFYLEKNNIKIIVEYDGKQHFQPVNFNGGIKPQKMIATFKKQKETDKLDKKFCKENNIILHRIKYNQDKEKSIIKLKKKINIF